jgi:hypothetical protein
MLIVFSSVEFLSEPQVEKLARPDVIRAKLPTPSTVKFVSIIPNLNCRKICIQVAIPSIKQILPITCPPAASQKYHLFCSPVLSFINHGTEIMQGE